MMHKVRSRSEHRARLLPVLMLGACALILLAMAVLDRLQAREVEQTAQVVRALGQARATLLAGFQRLNAPGDAGSSPSLDTEREAMLQDLQRLRGQLAALGGAAAGMPDGMVDQVAALQSQFARAARPALAAADRPALQQGFLALDGALTRVEARGAERLGEAMRRHRTEDAVGWLVAFGLLLLLGFGVARNLRRLRLAQAALGDSAAQFQHLLDLLPQMVWTADAQARVEYMNQRWAEFSGRPVAELLGTGWQSLMHPDDTPRLLEEWQAVVSQGRDTLSDFRLRRHDGSYRRFSVRFGVSRNAEGRPVRWFGSSLEVEEMRQAHDALTRSEQFHRSTLMALNDGVITFGLDGQAIGCNRAAERMLGLRRSAMVRRAPQHWGVSLRYEDGRAMPWDATPPAQVLASGLASRDVLMQAVGRQGDERWLHVNAEPVRGPDGGVTAVVASFRDVTERRRAADEVRLHRDHLESLVDERTRELSAALETRTLAEQRMKTLNEQRFEAERFIRLVADAVPGRISYWDQDLRCRFANRLYGERVGQDPERLVGRAMRDFRGDDYMAQARPRMEAALRGEVQDFERAEYDASGVRTEVRVQYIPDVREGEVKGFVVLATDITRHKQIEQLLRETNEQLAEARDRATAASQAKSTFLANMSHEIRTPMNAIIGFTHMLRREVREPVHQHRLQRISQAANHLLQVINDILDLSKIEAGKLALESVDFSLDAVLSRTCAMVAEPAREKGLELVMRIDPLPDRLHGDPTRIMQALLNLLGNAVKFTERGAVTLRVIPLAQDNDGLLVRFEVQDTGIGIAPDEFEQLFNPFSQVDGSRVREHGGTGLGLAITRHIAQRMGGEAGGDSEPGRGSRFWFTARLGRVLDQEASGAPVLDGLRALVADDLVEAREALAGMLRGLGMRVDSVANGTDALAHCEAAAGRGDPYAVVLLDWSMPGLDGLETGTRLADGLAPPQAMVLLSSREHVSVQQLARDAGFGAVLMKPATPSMLLDCLMRLLRKVARPSAVPEAAVPFDHRVPDSHVGARVLLAEDNPVNQEVAAQLLRSAGLEVDIADDGQQAVQMARTGGYALVLMDMQMPRMDGLQATRLLRQDPAFIRLPIVAMTANAFQEDREACLAAGMNDHLAKPVDPRVLHAVLVRWLPRERPWAPEAAPPIRTAPAPRPMPAPPPSLSPLPSPLLSMPPSTPKPERTPEERLAGLERLIDLPRAYGYSAGQATILLRVVERFVEHYREAGIRLLVQLGEGDRGTVARTLHSLRGDSGTIGADTLRSQVIRLEQDLGAGRSDEELRAPMTELRETLDALVLAMARAIG